MTNMFRTYKSANGFTLIELLVVISIIGVLASVVLASLNSARARARDANRAATMRQLELAINAYFQDYGSYPVASWRGYQLDCVNAGTLSGPSGYIPNLAPTYIASLPVDVNGQSGCNGFMYSSDGREYMLLLHGSPESYSAAGGRFYDPIRPTWAWKLCSGYGCNW